MRPPISRRISPCDKDRMGRRLAPDQASLLRDLDLEVRLTHSVECKGACDRTLPPAENDTERGNTLRPPNSWEEVLAVVVACRRSFVARSESRADHRCGD